MKNRVTKWGFLVYSIFIAGVVLFFASNDLYDGRASDIALFAGLALIAVSVVVASVLKAKGIELVENEKSLNVGNWGGDSIIDSGRDGGGDAGGGDGN